MSTRKNHIRSFDFEPGQRLAGKYEVVCRLGAGWEGEVYLLEELRTGIERAGKIFFPQRNQRDRAAMFYAKKLHKLRHCPILIQYHGHETVRVRGNSVTLLVSDYVEGELFNDFLKRQPFGRLTVFEGMHLLHDLASGVETIHHAGEYHGDLHGGNIILRRQGLSFDCKLLDFFQWRAPRQESMQDDVVDLIKLFYESIGGARRYHKQPRVVKDIVRGLKRSLILERFRTASHLREWLETMEWD